ncbi:MAG: NUDIX hydrolase [bacterium]
MIKRKYPNQPVVAVGAVIISDGRILLVQRKNEPQAKYWTLPGGVVEIGEQVKSALVREVKEECGVLIRPGKLIEAIDYIVKDQDDKIHYHYIILDFEAEILQGELTPGSDCEELNWFNKEQLAELNLSEITKMFFKRNYQVEFQSQ